MPLVCRMINPEYKPLEPAVNIHICLFVCVDFQQVQRLAASLMPGADSTTLQLMMHALSGNAPSTSQDGQQILMVQPFAQGFKVGQQPQL